MHTYSYTLLIHIPILKPIGGENSEHCLWFLLCSKIEYAMLYTYSYTLLILIPILKPIGDENSDPSLWFLLCSKSSMKYTDSYTLLIHKPISNPICDGNSDHSLLFLSSFFRMMTHRIRICHLMSQILQYSNCSVIYKLMPF